MFVSQKTITENSGLTEIKKLLLYMFFDSANVK